MNKGSTSSWFNQVHSTCIDFFFGSIISPFSATRELPRAVELLGSLMRRALPLPKHISQLQPWETLKVTEQNSKWSSGFENRHSWIASLLFCRPEKLNVIPSESCFRKEFYWKAFCLRVLFSSYSLLPRCLTTRQLLQDAAISLLPKPGCQLSVHNKAWSQMGVRGTQTFTSHPQNLNSLKLFITRLS